MGIAACLLFGVIAAWITRSMLAHSVVGSLKFILLIGSIGGLLGLLGILLGWGDSESFNLYNVLLSIGITALLTFLFSRSPRKAEVID